MPANASNDVFTDREMLANINDAKDPDGYATTTEIARQCGFRDNGGGHTLARFVASRLAWMRDGGLLESAPSNPNVKSDEPGSKDTRWRLTETGEAILAGRLTKTVSQALERMDAGAQVLLLREVTRRAYVEGETAVAFAIDRQYKNLRGQRKLNIRGRR